jgi:hypothetical protein
MSNVVVEAVNAEIVPSAETRENIAEVVDTEIVKELAPIHVSATMQIIISPEAKTMYKIEESVREMQQTISGYHVETTNLLSIMNTSLYHHTQSSSLKNDTEIVELLDEISRKMDAIAGIFASLPEWIPAHTLQESTGLSVDAIRKQLQNPKNFEPEVDYIQIGKIWHINKNAIPKVRRQK